MASRGKFSFDPGFTTMPPGWPFDSAPPRAKSFRPGDAIKDKKCPKCKNESIRIESIKDGMAQLSCRLCGGGRLLCRVSAL